MSDQLAFLKSSSEMGALMRAHDWSATPLGPREMWSPALTAIHEMMLASPLAMCAGWGPELTLLYNDAYANFLAARHPVALGQPIREVWYEVWTDIHPLIERAMTGGRVHQTDMHLVMTRKGCPEDTYWTFAYSPLRDGEAVVGFLNIATETTAGVVADRKLRASEEQLRLVIEGAQDHAILTTDPAGIITSWSAGAETAFGWPAAEIVGQSAELIFTPEDRAADVPAKELWTAGHKGCANDERWHLAKDGQRVFMNGSVHPLPQDAQGCERGFIKIARNETARRQTEEGRRALVVERDRALTELRLIANALPMLVAFVDTTLTYRFANAAYREWFDLPPDEVVGRTIREIAGEVGYATRRAQIERALGGEPVRMDLDWPWPDGRRRIADIRYLPRFASCGGVDGFYVFVQDVTALRDAAGVLSARNAALEDEAVDRAAELRLYRDIVRSDASPILAFDREHRLIGFNQAHADEFERVMGHHQMVGEVLPDLFPPEQAATLRTLMDRALAGERFVVTEEFGDSERAVPTWEITYAPLRDASGEIVGAFHNARDVSLRLRAERERDALEEQLRQSQKMEAVGQLTGGLAHDFNNLLAGISGSLELMQTRMQQGRFQDVERYMAVAQGAAKRAAALTHRLLAFSRRQTLDPKPTDVTRLAMGMQEMIQRTVGPGIPVEVVGATTTWPALVDPSQLENALLNLSINARDAMPNGGTITIETANKWMDERAARQHDMPEGQYLSLAVTDTGTGMPPEVIVRVFEPFFTTKPIGEGTGLGLSMIYGFAQQSGGQVRIYSEVGKGTTVCIYLPRHYGEVTDDTGTERAAALPRSEQGETVLVVDDEPTVRMLVTDVLEDLGYTAIEAGDSAAGLKVLQSDVRIDLLVTDVGLPGGMNGRQMADAGRVSRPDLKVLFITGYAENAILGNGHLAPGMAVLTKPFALDDMAARIHAMIEAGKVSAKRN